MSKFGERHDRALATLREIALPDLELRGDYSAGSHDYGSTLATLHAFVAEGEDLRAHLVAIAHGEADVARGDRRRIYEWQHLAIKISRTTQLDYKRFRRERAALGEDVDLTESTGPWALARGLTRDEAAELQVASFSRGVKQGLSEDEVADRIIRAMAAGKDLPF